MLLRDGKKVGWNCSDSLEKLVSIFAFGNGHCALASMSCEPKVPKVKIWTDPFPPTRHIL